MNNLDATIAGTGKEKDHINSPFIYNNIDDEPQNPTLQLSFADANIRPIVSTSDTFALTIIFY